MVENNFFFQHIRKYRYKFDDVIVIGSQLEKINTFNS